MSNYKVIKKKIDDLINIILTDGVQPSDLADNIFIDSYTQVIFKKTKDEIIGEIVFEESIELKPTVTIIRYFYTNTKKIIRIEEEIAGIRKIIWDRNYEEVQLANEIINMMKECYLPEQINDFVTTLPENIRIKLNYDLCKKKVS